MADFAIIFVGFFVGLIVGFTGVDVRINLARAKLVDWNIVALLCAGSISAALATIYALHQADVTKPELLAGSLPGVWLGTQFSSKVPERALRSLLSLLLAYAGLKFLAV